ncbi:hypothetical protein EJ04DRAFT_576758 [Polyplosphaeria fusca]|uniref:F-box domain-containing protein n=1 Tax=Polyplosphaeria fusca TaxID=682080 RepID=A0A9P4UZV7_9PLEO|nr:hypothetical protein EJ04DRAFT_576758 [Polyplosphaeria fusca]
MDNTAESTQHLQLQSPLLSLPAELVVHIVAQLSTKFRTLCSLARVCCYLQQLAEEHIYTSIELLSTDDLRVILNAFNTRPRRVKSVRDLKILYKFHEGLGATIDERELLNTYVGHMNNLRDWHVESPYDNFKWNSGGNEWVEHDMRSFAQALEAASLRHGRDLQPDVGLSKLSTLIIHSHGATTDFWTLGDWHCLFHHPSLRFIHISCVLFESPIPELRPFKSTTPLVGLIFDECELVPEALNDILATPKCLKQLELGENNYNTRRSRGVAPNLSNAPEDTLRALSNVAHSLETLKHYDPIWKLRSDGHVGRTPRLKGDGMRMFFRLTRLQCDVHSFIHNSIILDPPLAPPNLQSLRVRTSYDRNSWYHFFFQQTPDVQSYPYLSSLELVEYIQPIPYGELGDAVDIICEESRLRERHHEAYKLFKSGINMTLIAEVHIKPGLIPPYLYGETQPRLVTLYDAEAVGFQRFPVDRVEPAREKRRRYRSIFEDEVDGDNVAGGSELQSPVEEEQEDQQSATWSSETETKRDSPPETDQLGTEDILMVRNSMHRHVKNFYAGTRHLTGRRTPQDILLQIFGEDIDDDEFDMDHIDSSDDSDLDDAFFDLADDFDMPMDEQDELWNQYVAAEYEAELEAALQSINDALV